MSLFCGTSVDASVTDAGGALSTLLHPMLGVGETNIDGSKKNISHKIFTQLNKDPVSKIGLNPTIPTGFPILFSVESKLITAGLS